jgi:hypothetical protein
MRLNMQMPTKLARRTRPIYLPQLVELALNNGFHLEDRHDSLVTSFRTCTLNGTLNNSVRGKCRNAERRFVKKKNDGKLARP